MPEHYDPSDKSWEGDMFPVKALDSLRAWEKMIAWDNDSGRPPKHEIVPITSLEEGDMVHWYDYHEAYDGTPDEAGEVGEPYPEYSTENTGLVLTEPVACGDGSRFRVLVQTVSNTYWLNWSSDMVGFVRLVDRTQHGKRSAAYQRQVTYDG